MKSYTQNTKVPDHDIIGHDFLNMMPKVEQIKTEIHKFDSIIFFYPALQKKHGKE